MNEEELKLKEAELIIKEKRLQDLETLFEEKIRSGKADAGAAPEPPKEETPVAYKNRILKEMSE